MSLKDIHLEYEKWLGINKLFKDFPGKDIGRLFRNAFVYTLITKVPLSESLKKASEYKVHKAGVSTLQAFGDTSEVFKSFAPVKAPKDKVTLSKDKVTYGTYSLTLPSLKGIDMTKEEIALIAIRYSNLMLQAFDLGPTFYKEIISQGFTTEALTKPLHSRMFLKGHDVISLYGTYSNGKQVSNTNFFNTDLVGKYVYIPYLAFETLDEFILSKIKDTIEEAKRLDIPTAFLVHSFLHSSLSYNELVTYKYSLKDYEWYNIYTNKVVEPRFRPTYISVFDYNATLNFKKLIPDSMKVKVGLSITLSYKYSLYKNGLKVIESKLVPEQNVKDSLLYLHFKMLSNKKVDDEELSKWVSDNKILGQLKGADMNYVRPVKYYVGKMSISINDIRHKCDNIKSLKKVYQGHDFDHDLCSMLLSYYTSFDDFINIEEALFTKLGVNSETLVNPFCSHAIKKGKVYSTIHNDFMFGAVMSVKSYSTVMVSLSHFLVMWYLKSIETFTELVLVVVPFDKKYTKYTHFLIPSMPLVFNNSWVSKRDMMLLVINGTKSDIKKIASVLKELYQVAQ